jgi:hypothetical protein
MFRKRKSTDKKTTFARGSQNKSYIHPILMITQREIKREDVEKEKCTTKLFRQEVRETVS